MPVVSARLAALVVLSLTAACGGGSDTVVRRPATPTVTVPVTASSAPSQAPTRVPRHPVVAVRPATGLADGQSVAVSGSGFSPGLSLVVVQCAARGSATTSGDCNLPDLVSVQTDAEGKVAARLTVRRGPFGGSGSVCSARQPCLVSVSEATLSPAEEADAPISFR
ncbi:MAG: neocarzinostatin apoprotein domain-containing protein [Mycobacteriales bacterium]